MCIRDSPLSYFCSRQEKKSAAYIKSRPSSPEKRGQALSSSMSYPLFRIFYSMLLATAQHLCLLDVYKRQACRSLCKPQRQTCPYLLSAGNLAEYPKQFRDTYISVGKNITFAASPVLTAGDYTVGHVSHIYKIISALYTLSLIHI